MVISPPCPANPLPPQVILAEHSDQMAQQEKLASEKLAELERQVVIPPPSLPPQRLWVIYPLAPNPFSSPPL